MRPWKPGLLLQPGAITILAAAFWTQQCRWRWGARLLTNRTSIATRKCDVRHRPFSLGIARAIRPTLETRRKNLRSQSHVQYLRDVVFIYAVYLSLLVPIVRTPLKRWVYTQNLSGHFSTQIAAQVWKMADELHLMLLLSNNSSGKREIKQQRDPLKSTTT